MSTLKRWAKKIGIALLVAGIGLVIFGSYQMGRATPQITIELISQPGGVKYTVPGIDGKAKYIFYDYELNGSLDHVTIIEKDGKETEYLPAEKGANADSWIVLAAKFRYIREYEMMRRNP